MRTAASLMTLLLAGVCAMTGCDSGGDGTGSGGSETGGTNRAADILAMDGDAAAGQSVFTGTCGLSSCHSPDGSGSAVVGPLSGLVPGLSDQQIVDSLLNGKGGMPSQAALSDAELANVLAYVLENF